MSDSHFADGENDLGWLKSAIAVLGASEEEAQSIEPMLRTRRRSLAEEFLALDAADAAPLLAGLRGEFHRLIVHSGLRDVERDAEDQYLATKILQRLDESPTPASGVLLAAMLLFQAFELPVLDDLRRVPSGLLPDYARFLVATPRVFNAVGDADRYCEFATKAVSAFHSYVSHRPALPLAPELHDIFLGANLMQVYFNESNLKGLYRERAQLIESWAFAHGARLAHSFPLHTTRSPRRRLRVGILCHHFGPHTETYFMLAHFERFPRERCSLFLYATIDQSLPLSQYARSIADATVELPSDDTLMAAERIRADDLDLLLIGGNISIGVSTLTLLAHHRLARVQVVSASSPVTSGATSSDWYLSAEESETKDRAAAQYTEQVYRMPGMLTRYAYHLDKDRQTVKMDRTDLGIPKNAVVFFSASNFYKVIPELSATWARIMAQVPDARLILMPFNLNWSLNYLSEPFAARLLRQVKEAGGEPDYVHFIRPLPARADLHGIMALADIYLDSYPFAGACSLLDPLLVGLPIVARTGHTFRGDVGAGMLRGLGLGDMAAPDEAGYIFRALSLARSADLRKRERARIQAALSPHNPVFDSDTGSRNMEAAFVDMVGPADALEEALLRQPANWLRTAVERLAAELARDANPWFRSLNDIELVRLLVVPYFESLAGDGETRHMLDVGACVGQMAEPFLRSGWKADLFEPDPACREALANLAGRFGERVAVHEVVVSNVSTASVTFYQASTGLSGLSPSPYSETASTFSVPSVRLADFVKMRGLERLDFLKVDAEGWDFEVLRSHDFSTAPPRLAMVEFGTEFARQSMDAIMESMEQMAGKRYDALVFSYEDNGNFKRQIWQYDLIAAGFGAPVARKSGHTGGNIIFFPRDDAVFLAIVLRLLLGFLPPRERQPHYPNLQ